jgi:hypothetical protein
VLAAPSTGFIWLPGGAGSNFCSPPKHIGFSDNDSDYKAAMRYQKEGGESRRVGCQENEKGKRSPSGKRHKYLQTIYVWSAILSTNKHVRSL